MTVFVSTGGIKDKPGTKTALQMIHHGIKAIELSGGKYEIDAELKVLALEANPLVKIQIHNYYPPPKTPFVINLASEDPLILQKSMEHAKKAIEIASKISTKTASFHAGFLFDPLPSKLGEDLDMKHLSNRKKSFEIFCNSVTFLEEFAFNLEVELLIENNVITTSNLLRFNQNPLLLCDPIEIIEFFKLVPDRVKLLLDVAHLQISANTLGFEAKKALEALSPFVNGYHLSENDGTSDTNNCINFKSWFWKYLNPHAGFYTIEVYNTNEKVLRSQIEIAKQMIYEN